MSELTFIPATITGSDWKGERLDVSYFHDLTMTDRLSLEREGVEVDEGNKSRILVGVPANHDSVFTVGPYTITLDR